MRLVRLAGTTAVLVALVMMIAASQAPAASGVGSSSAMTTQIVSGSQAPTAVDMVDGVPASQAPDVYCRPAGGARYERSACGSVNGSCGCLSSEWLQRRRCQLDRRLRRDGGNHLEDLEPHALVLQRLEGYFRDWLDRRLHHAALDFLECELGLVVVGQSRYSEIDLKGRLLPRCLLRLSTGGKAGSEYLDQRSRTLLVRRLQLGLIVKRKATYRTVACPVRRSSLKQTSPVTRRMQ